MADIITTRAVGWGAGDIEWAHWAELGYGADLLPAVADPQAQISATSALKSLGKVPSVYNTEGKAVGISGWTRRKTTPAEVLNWSGNSNYSICLQTRMVRALDIDIASHEEAQKVEDIISLLLGDMPVRSRANSGKRLMVFTLPGELAKRRIITPHGVIEFLGTGQHFVACGTHPSGLRYEWAGGLPKHIPAVSLPDFNALWEHLAKTFGSEQNDTGWKALRPRLRGETVYKDDPVATFLCNTGWGVENRPDAVVIECPWEHEHSTGERGDGSTLWFRAGSKGHDKGHFRCLHAHCENRHDGDLFTAVGYKEDVAQEFEVIPARMREADLLPSFARDKQGRIEPTMDNITKAVDRMDICGYAIKFDDFLATTLIAEHTPDGSGTGDAGGLCGAWRAITDQDYTRLRVNLERNDFKMVYKDMVRDAVNLVAQERKVDSAATWIHSLKWDGVKRIDSFAERALGCKSSAYTTAVSTYLWTALAGRCGSPGCKADMVPILVGPQGTGKSTAVLTIAPTPEHFCEVDFAAKEDDTARRMRGKLVAEIGELRGLHTRELESIKAFVTRTVESWVPKFVEHAISYPRRVVFLGTTNADTFLADDTGNRRWLPLRIGAIDIRAIERDRIQLWAEGWAKFQASGVLYQDAQRLAKAEYPRYTMTDPWAEMVGDWLYADDPLTGIKPKDKPWLRAQDVLLQATGKNPERCGRSDITRIAAALRAFGYERKQISVSKSKRQWVFYQTNKDEGQAPVVSETTTEETIEDLL